MSKIIKYLCIDNEPNARLSGYLKRINKASSHLADIKAELPLNMSEQMAHLMAQQKANAFDGLILDHRLDDTEGLAKYRGSTMAQEIRTQSAEKRPELHSCPVVLWSVEDKLRLSYRRDDTSHDLFDLVIDKKLLDEEKETYPKQVAQKLEALVDGYLSIETAKGKGISRVARLLNVSEEFVEQLDPRIIAPLTNNSTEPLPIHEQALFILRQLLEIPNYALITREVVAARLGIKVGDVAKFDEEIDKLLPNARYTGAFAAGWPCWWAALIEQSWEDLLEPPVVVLRLLPAARRVAIINEVLGSSFEPATPPKFAKSTHFWTSCILTHQPLDPEEGYQVSKKLHPWQLTQFASLIGLMDGQYNAASIEVDPLEQDRLAADRKSKSNAK